MAKSDLSSQLMRFYNEHVVVTNDTKDRLRPSRRWVVERVQQRLQLEGEPINQGSFYNGTAAGRPTDFDVLLPVSRNGAPFTARTVEPYGRVYFHVLNVQRMIVSSDDMLNSFYRDICSLFYDQSAAGHITKRRPAVSIYLSSKNVTVDLVPCVRVGDALYIAKGSDEAGRTKCVWKRCRPQEEKNELQRLAGEKNNFKAIIRLLKFVCKQNGLAISSHAIQSVVVRSCRNDTDWNRRSVVTNYSSMIHALKAALRSRRLPDWVFPSENMLEDITDQERIRAISVLEEVHNLLQKGDVGAACSIIQ